MWNRVIRSLWANIFLAVLAAFVLAGALPLLRSALQARRDEAGERARLEELTLQKKELAAQIREGETESGVRYLAHLRLNLKNPGEVAVVVLPEQKETPAVAAPPLWQKIKNLFSGIWGAWQSIR